MKVTFLRWKAHFVTSIQHWNSYYRCKAQLKFLLASELHEPAPNTEMLQILFNSRTMCGQRVDTI